MKHRHRVALLVIMLAIACAFGGCGRTDLDRFNQMIYGRDGRPRANPVTEITQEWFPAQGELSDSDATERLHELAWIVEHAQGIPRIVAARVLMEQCRPCSRTSRLIDQRVVDVLVKHCLAINQWHGSANALPPHHYGFNDPHWNPVIEPAFVIPMGWFNEWLGPEFALPWGTHRDLRFTKPWRLGRVRLRLDAFPEVVVEDESVVNSRAVRSSVNLLTETYLPESGTEGLHRCHYVVEIVGPNDLKSVLTGEVEYVAIEGGFMYVKIR